MAFDPIRELTEAGLDLRMVAPEQLEIVSALGADEVATLIDIHRRLAEAEPEVQAHIIGGLLF